MSDELLRKKFQKFLEIHNINSAKTPWYRDLSKLIPLAALLVSIHQCSQKDVEIGKIEGQKNLLTSEITSLKSRIEQQKTTTSQLQGIQEVLVNQIQVSVGQLGSAITSNDKANTNYTKTLDLLRRKEHELKAKNGETIDLQKRYEKLKAKKEELDKTYKKLKGDFAIAYNTLLNVECDLDGYLDYFKGDGLSADMIANIIKPSAISVDRGVASFRRPYIVVLSIHYPELLKSKVEDRIKNVKYINVIDAKGNPLELVTGSSLKTSLGGPLDAKFSADYQAYTLPETFTVEVNITPLNGSKSKTFRLNYPTDDGKFTIPENCKSKET